MIKENQRCFSPQNGDLYMIYTTVFQFLGKVRTLMIAVYANQMTFIHLLKPIYIQTNICVCMCVHVCVCMCF